MELFKSRNLIAESISCQCRRHIVKQRYWEKAMLIHSDCGACRRLLWDLQHHLVRNAVVGDSRPGQ